MCLILFAYRAHKKYPLIIAANRDEFFSRPTIEAKFWEQSPKLLAGRDELAGGTWLGVNKNGRFSAITNFRQAQDLQPLNSKLRSRGEIAVEFLQQQGTPLEFAQSLHQKSDSYNGFNVLLGDTNHLVCYSNKSKQITELTPGIYGLSNHLLNSPWQKVEEGKRNLKTLISSKNSTEIETEDLLSILTNSSTAPDNMLPDTGFPAEKEKMLSAAFISSGQYGTCCSTAITFGQQGRVRFHERNYPKTEDALRHLSDTVSNQQYEFTIS